MKKISSFLVVVALLFTACQCGYTNPPPLSPSVSGNTTIHTGGRRQNSRDREEFVSVRTVQVLKDCTPKAGVVVVGTDDPEKFEDGRGTGIIIRSKSNISYIFTAAHVILTERASDALGLDCSITVKRDRSVDPFQRTIKAKVIAFDRKRDIAVLAVAEDLKVSTSLEQDPILGEDVFAVGYPVQLMNGRFVSLSITRGTIATLNVPRGSRGSYHRVTSEVYFGNSGGGVWTKEGKLVGIVVILFAKENVPFAGYYYIKPVNEVVDLLKKKRRHQEVFGGK